MLAVTTIATASRTCFDNGNANVTKVLVGLVRLLLGSYSRTRHESTAEILAMQKRGKVRLH